MSMGSEGAVYFRYWGKARPGSVAGAQYHLLPYHCLDVAAVAQTWWCTSSRLRSSFTRAVNCGSSYPEQKLEAWLLFFTTLHDLGKLDARFQKKAEHAIKQLWNGDDPRQWPRDSECQGYAHGPMGFYWFCRTHNDLVSGVKPDGWIESWSGWLAAVAGHHGEVVPPNNQTRPDTEYADESIVDRDMAARRDWLQELERLFLSPAGLNLQAVPPPLSPAAQTLLAGFCAVSDWLGSKADPGYFSYYDVPPKNLDDLRAWLQLRQPIAEKVVKESGLAGNVRPFESVAALLNEGDLPRQVQTLVDQLPLNAGLTLIEAPTGCGKTEAALAYAWRLLDAGMADSIVFALPTQATANAMLARLEKAAEKLFEQGANVVLAHGKSAWNEDFYELRKRARGNVQGQEEAWTQCREFLAQSRKRAFLGQIGVCTVDQVLLSVLPFKYKFVRGFGVLKSVLIVDEVHAYSFYMYGLLEAVLRQQAQAGGSAILLSATLPVHQRKALISAWGGSATVEPGAAYPLISHVATKDCQSLFFTLPEKQRPARLDVHVETLTTPGAALSPELEARMVEAIKAGALLGIVCNLVDDAQVTARRLRVALAQAGLEGDRVDLFHARYRFMDRAEIEKRVVALYGKGEKRVKGRVVVATQVIEQSLDLDFDWLITQLCPADLLFQRMGRLHRHPRERPEGFAIPHCTVLAPENQNYGLHELIYGNVRVLWRTEQLLRRQADIPIRFPEAYRDWIEKAYAESNLDEVPDGMYAKYLAWIQDQKMAADRARRLTSMTIGGFNETENTVSGLTRDGEMSLPVLPVQEDGTTLLDGVNLSALNEGLRAEAINLNTVNVPASWKRRYELQQDDEGLVRLRFAPGTSEAWRATDAPLVYSKREGLYDERKIGAPSEPPTANSKGEA